MIAKVLVANRGEIAVRIFRACARLGIRSVAIYSDADCDALHVRSADEAYPCGAAPARESYLDIDRVIAIAKKCGADAIHPGYGFLSENAAFADECARANIRFIGPSADAIRALGSKLTSRRVALRAGVPIVPGATEALDDGAAIAFAQQIGFPVMVKVSEGGGGRGLRLVRREAELVAALPRARSEAAASFGSEAIYIEKFIEHPRHIEIQVLADDRGGAIQLMERECSIQRRHQKLLEEAPGNRIPAELREGMGEAAIAMVRAVGYVGAGTCEFLVDSDGNFHFLEMNTRIQVEHAISEEVTRIDIVREMIRIAAGEPLAYRQSDVAIHGHAIEARIYAEDPDKKFLPSPGTITAYRAPEGPGLRVDSGVAEGSLVSTHYDAMLAKLIAWGEDRSQAIERLVAAVADFRIEGIRTSLPLHARILQHPEFLAGRYDTSFLQEHFGAP
ncbi:MAG: acetyl-CoA carboxylase biotin carboxylase subunit [Deltaproteobacteria bacterium]|nr:acetyl-CoA carboxylase biotin carboxylase subunit [Deltaproteobacteria bacterium]MBW2400077.1 acetyl-CoA carboxylase biotin carboxylase subunit [Deltaproteobacteria bacterium]MBW2664904.1 acetyl-CoA carboxylase biotin carboxylase subunit [Deltaproteobacteria bacterium]